MEHDQLRHLLKQRPFQPFRVYVRDGRAFDIQHPEMNLLARSFIKIGIPEPNVPDPICDHLEFVPLAEITRVEPLPGNASPLVS